MRYRSRRSQSGTGTRTNQNGSGRFAAQLIKVYKPGSADQFVKAIWNSNDVYSDVESAQRRPAAVAADASTGDAFVITDNTLTGSAIPGSLWRIVDPGYASWFRTDTANYDTGTSSASPAMCLDGSGNIVAAFGTSSWTLKSITPDNVTVNWSISLSHGHPNFVSVSGSNIFVQTGSVVQIVAASTGSITASLTLSSPVGGGGAASKIWCEEEVTDLAGSLVSDFSGLGQASSPAATIGNDLICRLIIPGTGSFIARLTVSGSTTTISWSVNEATIGGTNAVCIGDDGNVYMATDAAVKQLNPSTGAVNWTYHTLTGDEIYSIAYASNTLYIAGARQGRYDL